jgi:hypothetical protein
MLVASSDNERLKDAGMVDFDLEFDGLAAYLAVLDIGRRTGAEVDQCLEGFAAIRAVNLMKFSATR